MRLNREAAAERSLPVFDLLGGAPDIYFSKTPGAPKRSGALRPFNETGFV
jgi:hypothetical protein